MSDHRERIRPTHGGFVGQPPTHGSVWPLGTGGIVRVREVVTLEPGGNTYSGHGVIELLDADLNLIVPLSEAPVHATRIRAE